VPAASKELVRLTPAGGAAEDTTGGGITLLIFTAQAGAGGDTAMPPATLPSTGGEGQATLWIALAAALSGGAGLTLRRRAVR
jgi:LPXTG-motif cell wall-anchored protein